MEALAFFIDVFFLTRKFDVFFLFFYVLRLLGYMYTNNEGAFLVAQYCLRCVDSCLHKVDNEFP